MRDIVETVAPEVAWILHVLRSRYTREVWDQPSDLDWAIVLETARRNAVVPLVSASLPSEIPPDVRATFEAEARWTRLGNLAQTKTLLSILDVLDTAGVRSLPYKGPVLAQVAYGDLGLRRFTDLDVLVDRRAVPAALAALRDAGFEAFMDISPSRLAALVRTGHDWALSNEAGDVLELQWAIASRAHARPRGVEPLIDRASAVNIGGREVRTLNPTDQVVVLAIHGGIHLWARLAWVCDLVQAMALPDVIVDSVASVAYGVGAYRSLLIGVSLVERLFDVRPLPELAERANADPSIARMVDDLAGPLLSVGGPDLGLASGRVRTRARLADRAWEGRLNTVRALITPTPADWAAHPLPEALSLMYYPIRAARLVAFALGRRPESLDVFDAH